MKKSWKKLLAPAIVTCAVFACSVSFSSDLEKVSGPISIVVPYTPGGAVDALTRIVAKHLTADTGVNFVIENKPGAGGAIAAAAVARARPDGRTLLMGSTNTHGVLSAMRDKLQYDPIKDFSPISDVAENIVILAANRDFPANDLEEAVALIKRSPNKYSFASPGVGTMQQLAMELLAENLELDIVHIAYKGATPAASDTAAGTVPLAMGGTAPFLSFLAEKRLKILGVANKKDGTFSEIPEVEGKQFFEDIQKDSAIQSWIGLFAPANVDNSVLDFVHTAVQKIVVSDSFKEEIKTLGMIPNASSRDEFAQKVKKDVAYWKENIPASVKENN